MEGRIVSTYEFTLTVVGFDLDSEFQNAGLECLDYAAVVGSVGGITQVDVEIEADSPEAAILRVLSDLHSINVTTRRIELDLVSAPEIAIRLGKSRETVRLWSNGERRSDFPAAYSTVGESLAWAWADVHEWAEEQGINVGDTNPIPVVVAEAFTGAFAQTFVSHSQGWLRTSTATGTPVVPKAPTSRPAADWAQPRVAAA